MASNFKDLNLDRKCLKDCIEKYCYENNFQLLSYAPVVANKESHYRLTYKHEDVEVKVDFHFNGNGTTTINTKVGKPLYHEKGEPLANFIKQNILTDANPSITVSTRNIEEEIFSLLVLFLEQAIDEDKKTKEFLLEDSDSSLIQTRIKVTSINYQDSLIITYYKTTKSLLIQGKPLYSYSQVSYFLAEYLDYNGFMEIVYKGSEMPNKINVDTDTINKNLQSLLPHAHAQVGDVIMKMLTTSYTLKDIDIHLPDYSCYVFPALRSLEGVMKNILFNKYFEPEKSNQYFNGIFRKEENRYVVTDEYKSFINDSNVCRALGTCYTYYNSCLLTTPTAPAEENCSIPARSSRANKKYSASRYT
ncbi:MAG: type II toxin-antitoxin system RnlA family toxin, partial [Aphanizomenon gracile PMC649.10]|nr:type II toxin-antitoxin system RnlA family toxin [Aphanizomenon gracile PMC649.10]